MKILLVEDDDAIAAMLPLMLPQHTIDRARDGQEALDFTLEKYDLLLVDGEMPRLSGPAFLATIDGSYPPAIGLTSSDHMASRFCAMGLPVVKKPFSCEDLNRAVARAARLIKGRT